MSLLSKMSQFLKRQERPIPCDYIEVDGIRIYQQDIQLLKTIKLAMSKNLPVIIHPPKIGLGKLLEDIKKHDTIAEEINYMSYQNAVERKRVEGWSAEKTLIETGYYVPD
jgi:hypothetical protein